MTSNHLIKLTLFSAQGRIGGHFVHLAQIKCPSKLPKKCRQKAAVVFVGSALWFFKRHI